MRSSRIITLTIIVLFAAALLIGCNAAQAPEVPEVAPTSEPTPEPTPEPAIEHSITLNLNYEDAEELPAFIVEDGATISDVPTFEREGFLFLHWSPTADGEDELSEDKVFVEDVVLYAQWVLYIPYGYVLLDNGRIALDLEAMETRARQLYEEHDGLSQEYIQLRHAIRAERLLRGDEKRQERLDSFLADVTVAYHEEAIAQFEYYEAIEREILLDEMWETAWEAHVDEMLGRGLLLLDLRYSSGRCPHGCGVGFMSGGGVSWRACITRPYGSSVRAMTREGWETANRTAIVDILAIHGIAFE